jgi:hypothetical protein
MRAQERRVGADTDTSASFSESWVGAILVLTYRFLVLFFPGPKPPTGQNNMINPKAKTIHPMDGLDLSTSRFVLPGT